MELVVIDASVLIKWFVNEIKSDSAIEIRDKYIKGEISLIAPNLILYEVLNALKYIKLHNQREMVEIFETIINYGIVFHDIEVEMAKEAIAIAKGSELSLYDSTYVALAKIKHGELITADEKLVKNIPKSYKKNVRSL